LFTYDHFSDFGAFFSHTNSWHWKFFGVTKWGKFLPPKKKKKKNPLVKLKIYRTETENIVQGILYMYLCVSFLALEQEIHGGRRTHVFVKYIKAQMQQNLNTWESKNLT